MTTAEITFNNNQAPIHAVNHHSGLNKIVLFDSYIPSKLVRIPCDGNLSLSGDNGKGKTSLLTLIPIFLGLEPKKALGKLSADKVPFNKYYLPRNKSLIVYEYYRRGIPATVLLTEKNNTLFYRFVDTPVENLLSEQQIKLLEASDSVDGWLKSSVEPLYSVSKKLLNTQYSMIIQNDTRKLAERNNQHRNVEKRLLAQYSLVGGGKSIKHLDLLMSVLVRSQGSLISEFKLMVEEAFVAGRIDLSELPAKSNDDQQLSSLETLTKLNDKKHIYQAILSIVDDIYAHISFLIACNAPLGERIHDLSLQAEALVIKITEDQRAFEEQQTSYQEQRGNLQSQLTEHTNLIRSLETFLDNAYTQREHWDAQNIETKKVAYDDLPQLLTKAKEAAGFYDTLIEQSDLEQKQIEAEFDKAKHEVEIKTSKAITKAREVENTLQKDLHQKQTEVTELVQFKRDEHRNELDAFKQIRREEESSLNEILTTLHVQEANASQLTSEEIQAAQGVEIGIEQKRQEMSVIQEELNEINRALLTLSAEYAKEERILSSYQTELDTLKVNEKELDKQINPTSHSFRSQLNKHLPDWRNSIGKVIRPGLLNKTNLDPVFQQGDEFQNHLYGVSLMLDNIELPEHAMTEQQLIEKREHLLYEEQNLEKHIKEARTKLTRLSQEQQAQEVAKQKIEQRAPDITSQIQQLQDQLEAIKQRNLQQAGARKDKAHQAVVDQEARLAEHREATPQQVNDLSSKQAAALQQYQFNLEQPLLEIELAITQQQHNMLEAQKKRKERIDALKALRLSQITEKGLDAKHITDAKQQKEDAQSKLETVQSYYQTITDYERWRNNTGTLITGKEQALEQSQSTLNTAKLALEGITQAFNLANAKHKEQRKEDNDSLNQLNKQIAGLQNAATRVESYSQGKQHLQGERINLQCSVIINNISEDISHNIRELDKKTRSLRDKLDNIKIELNKASATHNSILTEWNALEQRRLEQPYDNESEIERLAKELGRADDVEALFTAILPAHTQTVISSIRTTCEAYQAYFTQFDVFERQVSAASKDLEKGINIINPFPAIDKVSVSLSTSVKRFHLYTMLEEFNLSYTAWKRQLKAEPDALPNTSLINNLRLVLHESSGKNAIGSSISDLLEVTFTIIEQGNERFIRTDDDLKHSSSKGISKLGVLLVFMGLCRKICPDSSVTLHWPIDELGELSAKNVKLLFDLFKQQNILLVSALPDLTPLLMPHFKYKYAVDIKQGVKRYVDKKGSGNSNPLIQDNVA